MSFIDLSKEEFEKLPINYFYDPNSFENINYKCPRCKVTKHIMQFYQAQRKKICAECIFRARLAQNKAIHRRKVDSSNFYSLLDII